MEKAFVALRRNHPRQLCRVSIERMIQQQVMESRYVGISYLRP